MGDGSRLHNRQVGGLLTPENATHIDAGLPKAIGCVGAVAHQHAGHYRIARRQRHRQSMAQTQRRQLVALAFELGITGKKRRGPLLDRRHEGRLYLSGGAGFQDHQFQP